MTIEDSTADAPLLTAEFEPVGGAIKQRVEDFLVEEIPLYDPAGEGEHVYLFVEKKNLTTDETAKALARHFGVRRRDVGVAGQKDKRAITRQVFSVHTPGKKPEDFPEIRKKGVAVLWVDLHTNKLRTGHLKANRFSVRIRDVDPMRVLEANKIVERLAREGVPNYFGPQRFGTRANNHLVAKKLIEGDEVAALQAMLDPGESAPADDPVRVARDHFLAGELPDAIEALPREMMTENRILRSIARGCDAARAFKALPRKDVDFLFCAFQSAVFNRVLADRLRAGQFDKLAMGDIAMRTDNGACFVVDDEAMGTIGDRCDSFEVSPTGPLVGEKTLWPAEPSDAHNAERAAVDAIGVTLEQFAEATGRYGLSLPGARRPLRVRLGDPEIEGGADEHGAFIRLAFDLPPGCYATSVVREISKNTRIVSA